MSSKLIKITALTFASISLFAQTKKSSASSFSEKEIDQQQIITVAVPFGYKEHKLEIIEQIPNQQQCWNESGNSPVTVDLLLLNFDHTDSCKRIKDSNGYSIRIDDNDEKSSLYLIRVLQRNGELQVVAKHENPSLPELIIGRSKGLGGGALKIDLEPGWKIAKREYQGKTLSHVYLSGDSQVIAANKDSGQSRQGLRKPSAEVAGTFQIFQSNLAGCEPGSYQVSGQFDPSLTQLTINQATGAEACFDSLPAQIFNTPGLLDNGEPVDFISNAAPGMGQLNGSVRRVHGSFTTPVTYASAKDTIGLLVVNSQNTVVKSSPEKVLTELPGNKGDKVSEILPDLIPNSSSEDRLILDTRPESDTSGLTVVTNKIKVAFEEDATVEEVNQVLKTIGGGIVGSFKGGTIVTIEIPDTGNLDGLENVDTILATQPSVFTTAPIVIDMSAAGDPPGQAFASSSLNLAPAPACNPGENTPLYLQVTGGERKKVWERGEFS